MARVLELITKSFTPLYKVFIYSTTVLLQLHQFWNTIQGKLVHKGPYITNIRAIKMKLLKLQNNNKKTKKLRVERLIEGWEDIKEIFHSQHLLYISRIFFFEQVSRHYDNPLTSHYGIEKTQDLIS